MLPRLRNLGKTSTKINGFWENIWGRARFSGEKTLDLMVWSEIHPQKCLFQVFSAFNHQFFYWKSQGSGFQMSPISFILVDLRENQAKIRKKTTKEKDLKDKSTEELSTNPLKIPTKPFKLLPKIRKFMENSSELSQKICIKVLKDSQFQIYPGKLLPHLAQYFLFFGNVSFYLGFLLVLGTFLGILLGFFSLF